MSGSRQLPKLKHIESFLSDLDNFEKGEFSKLSLEQHMTPPNVAAICASMVAELEDDLEEQTIGDFGCGTGMLSCAMLYLGAARVIGLEMDKKYAEITLNTLDEKFEDQSMYEIVIMDVKQWKPPAGVKLFDTVVMNPPFGTKDEGIDAIFLDRAFATCRGNVYSMHKSSTRKFLQKKAEACGYEFKLLQEIKFPLPKRFTKYHKKDVAYTEVDFIQFKPKIQQQQLQQQQQQQAQQKIEQIPSKDETKHANDDEEQKKDI